MTHTRRARWGGRSVAVLLSLTLGLLRASGAAAAPAPVTLSGAYSGQTHTVSESCGFHTVRSFAVTATLTPGPKLQGTIALDYCTSGGPMTGSWTLTTKQGTLRGGYGTWSRTSACPTPSPACVDHLSLQLLPTAGTGVFARFHGGELLHDADNAMTSGSFPSEWWGTTVAAFGGTLTN